MYAADGFVISKSESEFHIRSESNFEIVRRVHW